MPIGYRDVELLNRSMAGLGDSFRQRRLDEGNERQQAIENELRQNMMGLQERQYEGNERQQAIENELRQNMMGLQERQFESSEANRIADNERLGGGNIEAWIQPEGQGSPVRFMGPQKGLDALMQAAQQGGKTLRVVNKPEATTKKAFKITSELPVGTVEYELDTLEDLEKAVATLKQHGGKTPNKSPGQSGRVRELQQAIEYRNQAESEIDPDKKARLLKFAEDLEAGKPVKLGSEKEFTALGEKTTNIYGTPGKAPGAAAPSGSVKVSTKEERDRLPAGTEYIGPDGKEYIKK